MRRSVRVNESLRRQAAGIRAAAIAVLAAAVAMAAAGPAAAAYRRPARDSMGQPGPIYWADQVTGSIGVAGLDDTDPHTVITGQGASYVAVSAP
jgi:hypothetical protein